MLDQTDGIFNSERHHQTAPSREVSQVRRGERGVGDEVREGQGQEANTVELAGHCDDCGTNKRWEGHGVLSRGGMGPA